VKAERGVALIVALLILSFLTVLGGALLSSSTLDIWISDNYKTSTQNLYLTEAGIDQALERLRIVGQPSHLLTAAAGTNGELSTATELGALLASDDQPVIPSDASLRSTGENLTDSSGTLIGRYHVWLRNDNADGMNAVADTNEVLTLLSFGRIGNSRKAIEVTVKRWAFPAIPAPLTLDGAVDLFDPTGAAFPVDFSNNDDELEPQLRTVSGLETIVARIEAHATDIHNPASGTPQVIGTLASPSDYRITVVNGDVQLGPGEGHGLLVARGNVTIAGDFTWHGLILVIGQGVLRWNRGIEGAIDGGIFLARTRAPDGSLLVARGGVTADFNGAAGSGIHYNPETMTRANQGFPYVPIAIRERN
jgi:type IV pilus assembly protein PilX